MVVLCQNCIFEHMANNIFGDPTLWRPFPTSPLDGSARIAPASTGEGGMKSCGQHYFEWKCSSNENCCTGWRHYTVHTWLM